jgi:uncharacterized alkaline shock family protein YloU
MSDFSPENMTIGNGPKPFTPRPDDTEPQGRPITPASGVAGLPTGSLPGTSSPAHAASTQQSPQSQPTQPSQPSPSSPPAHRAQASTPSAADVQGFGQGAGQAQAVAPGPEVKGRIEVADEVVEKVAGLACMEVAGVADLGGDIERALESVRERIGIGNKRGDQGIKAKITGREVSIDVTIMIEYGHVVMDVARNVKANVAAQTSRMLGLKVVEVNVTVDDVRLPGQKRKGEEGEAEDGLVTIEG